MLYPIIHMSTDPKYYRNKLEGKGKLRENKAISRASKD